MMEQLKVKWRNAGRCSYEGGRWRYEGDVTERRHQEEVTYTICSHKYWDGDTGKELQESRQWTGGTGVGTLGDTVLGILDWVRIR